MLLRRKTISSFMCCSFRLKELAAGMGKCKSGQNKCNSALNFKTHDSHTETDPEVLLLISNTVNLRITFVESAGSLTMKENEVIMWCHIVVSTRKKHDQDESFKTKCLLFYWQHTCSKKKKEKNPVKMVNTNKIICWDNICGSLQKPFTW